MDANHRELLTSNCKQLVSFLVLDERLLLSLILRKVFTQPMLTDILSKKTEEAQKEELISELKTRGPLAFQKFLNILDDLGQTNASAILRGKVPHAYTKKPDLRKHSEAGNKGPMQLVVRKAKEMRIGDKIFKMFSKPRGKCLIINNIDFDGILSERSGSQTDGMRLDQVFTQLDYHVILKCDQKAEEMKELLQKFAKDPEHSDMDSCVVIILSHGDSGLVYGTDCEKVLIKEDILFLFDNENCPGLIRKPKLFFIQACRGRRYDSGVGKSEYTDATSIDAAPMPSVARIPTCTDMLIAYSTVDGYFSVRDKTLGSWFCQELVDSLIEHACDEDLESILKVVDEKVQARVSPDGDKQATEVTHWGWYRTFYFNPGIHEL